MATDLARFLDEVKSKLDIVDIVSKYVTLNQKGGRYWGCCPFHHEKTASFSVDRARQFFHCFGCKESGDIVKFIEHVEATDFLGAVSILAQIAGLEVPKFSKSISSNDTKLELQRRNRIFALLKDVARYYNSMLKSPLAKEVNEYLKNRGISESTISKFGLGFSPDWTSSIVHLRKLGYTNEEMVQAGIAGNKNGKFYDAYAGRIMFPVIKQTGEVVAFGGRTMDKHAQAKYKNTAETEFFHKKNVLYGLNLIKKMRLKEPVTSMILVEGYMDAISVYEAGFKNVVASLGTAFTKEQADLISYYVKDLYISYDGDSAGIKGTLLGVEKSRNKDLNIKIIAMPNGLDPDEIIKKQGVEAYQKLIDAALSVVDFKIKIVKEKYNIENVSERKNYIEGILKVISKIKDNKSEEDFYLKKLRDESGVSYEALIDDLNSIKEGEKTTRVAIEEELKSIEAPITAIRFILCHVIDGKSSIKEIKSIERHLLDPTHQKIYQFLLENSSCSQINSLFRNFNNEEKLELANILNVKEENNIYESIEDKYFIDCLYKFRERQFREELTRYNSLFKHETDTTKKKEIAVEIQRIMKELKKS